MCGRAGFTAAIYTQRKITGLKEEEEESPLPPVWRMHPPFSHISLLIVQKIMRDGASQQEPWSASPPPPATLASPPPQCLALNKWHHHASPGCLAAFDLQQRGVGGGGRAILVPLGPNANQRQFYGCAERGFRAARLGASPSLKHISSSCSLV